MTTLAPGHTPVNRASTPWEKPQVTPVAGDGRGPEGEYLSQQGQRWRERPRDIRNAGEGWT
ncbi:hypothetical protein EAO68_34350 [Streptomyces sp. wa22]|nr:hypothetical protein EAO68_34350 [Streptomyces sp. wa22]